MSVIFPERGPLTDDFLAYLTGALTGKALVGDAEKPAAAGWDGQPGTGDYAAYVTLGTGDATPRNPPTVRQAHASWSFGYDLGFFGATRSQADWLADQLRLAALGYAGQKVRLGELTWSVQAVRYTRLGRLDRDDAQDPPVWNGRDTVALWVDAPLGGR